MTPPMPVLARFLVPREGEGAETATSEISCLRRARSRRSRRVRFFPSTGNQVWSDRLALSTDPIHPCQVGVGLLPSPLRDFCGRTFWYALRLRSACCRLAGVIPVATRRNDELIARDGECISGDATRQRRHRWVLDASGTPARSCESLSSGGSRGPTTAAAGRLLSAG